MTIRLEKIATMFSAHQETTKTRLGCPECKSDSGLMRFDAIVVWCKDCKAVFKQL